MGSGGAIYGLIGNRLFHRLQLPWTVSAALLVTLLLLAACSSDSAESPVQPGPTPTATAEPSPTAPALSADFATANIPPPDPQRLAQLKEMLSLVPADYGWAVHLDLKALRDNASLATVVSLDSLGLESALPSLVTSVLDGLSIATNRQTGAVITGFNGAFEVKELLRVAGGFGIQLGDDAPEDYRDHQIWNINFLGDSAAMGSANANTGVASAGSKPAVDTVALVKQSLDAFDRDTPSILDTGAATRLLENLPSGFASAVISECRDLAVLAETPGIPVCLSAAVSADLLDDQTAVFHFLAGFVSEELAANAAELARDTLEAQLSSAGLWEVGVRQEGNLVRARVIADLPQFEETFGLFTPRGR